MASSRKKVRPPPRLASRPGATPILEVDRELLAQWNAAIARFDAANAVEKKAWDAQFEAVYDILYALDKPLYLAGGYASARAFVRARLDMNEKTARQHARVAHHCTAEDEQRYGVSKLALLIEYLEKKGGAPLGRGLKLRPALTKVEVRLKGRRTERLFPELTFDELALAKKQAVPRRASAGAKGDPPLVTALRAVLARTGSTGSASYGGGEVRIVVKAADLLDVLVAVTRDAGVKAAAREAAAANG